MIKERVRTAIEQALREKDVAVEVAVPEKKEFGHFSSNVALRLGKLYKKNPVEIGGELKRKLERTQGKLFSKIEVVPPGFVNFWITDAMLEAELKALLKDKEKYFSDRVPKSKEKLQLEYVSSNPTGAATLANGRGGFLGDALANIFAATGRTVEREFYVNDTGNQIVTLGKSILARGGFMPMEEQFYQAQYVADWAAAHKNVLEKYLDKPWDLGRLAAKDFLADTKAGLKKARINFDRFTSEYDDIHEKKYPEKALKLFKKKSATYESEDAVWLKTTDFGDDKDRVIMTKDGYPTYFLADAGHYLETKERGFTRKINILGPDHYGYVARIQAAAELVGIKKSEVIVTQALRVIQGGTEVKMSKRRGTFLTFDEVVEEVGPDAARFFFLSVAPTTHMDFDMDLAKEQSAKNPVYYTQYSHARAASIMRKAKEAGVTDRGWKFAEASDEDRALVLRFLELSDLIALTTQDFEVNRLTRYALDLARAFHDFYEKERIIGEVKEKAALRLALVKAAKLTLASTFDLLGISAPEKM